VVCAKPVTLVVKPMNSIQKIYKKNPDIVFRAIAGELILIPLRRNVADLESIYTLNEVGAKIWELLDGKRDTLKIRDEIVKEFEVSPDTAEDDILGFLNLLSKNNMIKKA